MNILDENIIENQRQLLRRWRIAVRHLGYDVGRQGMQDEEIIPFLHPLRRPTFFTRDLDFYASRLCHRRYCLECNTVAKRMGAVIRVSHVGLSIWRLHAAQERHVEWAK